MINMIHKQVFTCDTQAEYDSLNQIADERFGALGEYVGIFDYEFDDQNLTITITKSFSDYKNHLLSDRVEP